MMIGENRFNNTAIRAVAIITLIVGLLAVAFVSVSANEPCIPCLANTAANQTYAARYTALAESFVPAAAVTRGADFDFLDHELMFAGGYALSPAATVARGADFDFLDHELMFAGGYALSPAAAVGPAAECDFVDHELMFAGGYAASPGPMVERGADFYFVDHELMYAGGYTLVPGTMVETGIAEVACGR